MGAPEKAKSSFSHRVFHFLFRVSGQRPKFAFQLVSELADPLGSAANGRSRSVWRGHPKNVSSVRICIKSDTRKRASEPSKGKRFEHLVGGTDVIGWRAEAPEGRSSMRSWTASPAPKNLQIRCGERSSAVARNVALNALTGGTEGFAFAEPWSKPPKKGPESEGKKRPCR